MQTNILPVLSLVANALFILFILAFIIHALILSYHWFSYGTSRSAALGALGIYISGGAVLFSTLAVALAQFS